MIATKWTSESAATGDHVAEVRILLQNDFERSATKFLIQGFNGQRKIDSSGGLLGFDCCVLDACRRLLQHNLHERTLMADRKDPLMAAAANFAQPWPLL
jgi:hypothetical protein